MALTIKHTIEFSNNQLLTPPPT